MKLLSRILLFAAKRMPRGYWRVIRFAARRDAALWDLPLPLRYVPDGVVRADLREPVYTQFLRYGCFPQQTGEDMLCMALLRPGDVVFDVGANIGYPTILFARLVGSEGLVVALEPSPRAFRLLKRTVGSEPNVRCLNVAASEQAGEIPFYETEGLDTSSLVPRANVNPYLVSTKTLDELAETYGAPAFVKIDVEGHEPAVFRGMKRLLQSERPPIVLFEALKEHALQSSLAELNRLAAGQYSVWRVRPDGSLQGLDEAGSINDYLAVPGWGRDRVREPGQRAGQRMESG